MNSTKKRLLATRLFTAIYGRITTLTCLFLGNTYHALSPHTSKLNIWVIGENRGECLKENGYWFYKYCRKHYPEQEVYFIVKKISPYFKQEMDRDPNVIPYGSVRHAHMFINSSICLYTHTYRDVMYRRFFELFGKKKKLVYLHHGVLGFKKINKFSHKHRNIMEFCVVGSNLEKDLLVNQAKVDRDKIKVLGYPRYDHLSNAPSPSTQQIIFIPTHRNYLKGKFTNSLFFHRVSSLLKNRSLSDLLTKNKIILKVYFHKEMQPYMASIKLNNNNTIKFIKHGEETPQNLISESNLMITDYSSVSWDFFYLGKPVVFYRFDIEEYTKDRDSYIDLHRETIGDIAFEEEDLIELIKKYINNNFTMKTEFSSYRKTIIPNIDKNNCERSYHEVKLLQQLLDSGN